MKTLLLPIFAISVLGSNGWCEWNPPLIKPIKSADGKTSLSGVMLTLRKSRGHTSVEGRLTATKKFSLCNIERAIGTSIQFAFPLAGEEINGELVYGFTLAEDLIRSTVMTICDPETHQLYQMRLDMFGVVEKGADDGKRIGKPSPPPVLKGTDPQSAPPPTAPSPASKPPPSHP